MISDGPESLEANVDGKSLICSGKGNPRASFQWIKLIDGNNVVYNGHELNMCNAVSFYDWKQQRALDNESDELMFQCVAQRGTIVARLNYTMSMNYIDSKCRTIPQTTGARI
jgi:hypothetical protein